MNDFAANPVLLNTLFVYNFLNETQSVELGNYMETSAVLIDLKPSDENHCILVFECDQLLVAESNIELKVPLVLAAKILELDKDDVLNYDKKIKEGLQFKELKNFINNDPYQQLIQSVKKELKIQ